MKVTIKDVAAYAHVSVNTVSRVINQRGYLSAETTQKVNAAMHALNYRPNSAARAMAGKEMGLIGLIFPQIANPFYSELIQNIETRLFQQGFKTILCNSFNDAEKENTYLDMLRANQVDGIITGSHNANLEHYRQTQLPIVAFDRYLGHHIPTVSSDNFTGGQLIGTQIIRLKAQRVVGFFSDVQDIAPTKDRILGLRDALKPASISPTIVNLPFNVTNQTQLAIIERTLIEHQPDAIVASDDLLALIIKHNFSDYLTTHSTALFGFDGTSLIQAIAPELMTVVQPIPDIADLLINLLIDKIKQTHRFENKQYVLPVTLRV